MERLLGNGGYVTLKALGRQAQALKPVYPGARAVLPQAGIAAPQKADDSLALICLEFG